MCKIFSPEPMDKFQPNLAQLSVLRSAKRAPANVRRLNNRKWRQRYCLVSERSRALALLNAALALLFCHVLSAVTICLPSRNVQHPFINRMLRFPSNFVNIVLSFYRKNLIFALLLAANAQRIFRTSCYVHRREMSAVSSKISHDFLFAPIVKNGLSSVN